MLILPLSIFTLPMFLGVLILDTWLLATGIWSIARFRSPGGLCDRHLNALVEAPVMYIRRLSDRKLRLTIPSFVGWITVLAAALLLRHILASVVVFIWCAN